MKKLLVVLFFFTFNSYSQSAVKTDYERGISEATNGNYNSAIKSFSKAINIDENNSKAYNNRGLCYLLIGKNSLGLIDFNKAIKLDRKNPFFISNRATCYDNLKKFNNAYNDYSNAINLNKNIGLFYYNRAITQNSMNTPNYQEAIEDLTKSISLKTNYSDFNLTVRNDDNTLYFYQYNLADAYYNRGFIYSVLNSNTKAINDYKKSIELKPSATAYYNLAQTYVQEEKFKIAIDELTKAIDINPNFAEAYGYRGMIYEIFDLNKACKDWEKAAKLGNQVVNEFLKKCK